MITTSNLITKSDDLLMSVIDKEAVLLGIGNGNYIGLNEIGTEIWSELSHPIRVSDLINNLVKMYDEDESIIKEQLIEFLNSLFEKSLIKIVNEVHS